jgi:ACT domain-containing protein
MRTATSGRSPASRAAHVILRVRMPDRPGALGAVASRIGAVGADICDVLVDRREGGSAVDVFHLTLPGTEVDVLALLVQEMQEVDGAWIESCEPASCCGDDVS